VSTKGEQEKMKEDAELQERLARGFNLVQQQCSYLRFAA
jgi:hypothetical protein